jgi:hypothetical protein
MGLQLASRGCAAVSGTTVQEVSDGDYGQHDSYHGARSFRLSLYIDSQIATQIFIGVFTLEIGFAGIHMSIVIVVKVFLNFIFGHGITSPFYCSVILVVAFI